MKDYVVADLQRQYPNQMVYRSKNFSSAIISSDVELNGDLTLKRYNDEYIIKVRSYKRYEWAREVMSDELNRNIYAW